MEHGVKITPRGGGAGAAPPQEGSAAGRAAVGAVAVATLGLLSVGGRAEATLPVRTLLPLADADGPASRPRQAPQ
jgi:hypothetical protein